MADDPFSAEVLAQEPVPTPTASLARPPDSPPLDSEPPPELTAEASPPTQATVEGGQPRGDKAKERQRPPYTRMYQSTPAMLRPRAATLPRQQGARGGGGDRARADSTASFLGPNHTFMQLINALSLEEDDLEDDRDTVASPISHSLTAEAFAPRPLALDEPEIDSGSSSEDDDEVEAAEQAPLAHSQLEEDTFHLAPDTSPVTPMTPLPASPVAPGVNRDLNSSIHAIYRPIAARRRTVTGEEGECVSGGKYMAQPSFGSRSILGSIDSTSQSVSDIAFLREGGNGLGSSTRKRGDTVSSVGRQAKLADKLEDIFGLTEREEVIAEYKCWLFRSVLLQGFMYLTTGHICFYAYLPRKEGAIIRSGSLSARGVRTRRYHKHWFILKDSLLSWFPSSTEPYFPDGHIDLHYCTSVEISVKHLHHFKVSTADKKWHFSADSEASRDEWVKTIKKVVFRCQNEGESVKISIPLETVIDIERSSNLEFAETVRVRVYDADEGYSIDEYWLSYFADLEGALGKMTEVLEAFRERNPMEEGHDGVAGITDTTTRSYHSLIKGATPVAAKDPPSAPALPHSSSSWSSRLRIFPSLDKSTSSLNTITEKDRSGLGTPRAASPSPGSSSSILGHPTDHTYPPDPAPGTPPPEFALEHRSSWSMPSIPLPSIPSSVTGWLKGPPKRIISATSSLSPAVASKGRKILEVVTPGTDHSGARDSDEEPEKPELSSEADDEKFRKSFGLGEKEHVVASFPAYLFRGLPIYGKVYISTTYFCFKSIALLTKTKMILPLHDIIATSRHRSYRIGYSGLIVVIQGHEEIFFELHSSERRDDCLAQIERQIDFIQYQVENSAGTATHEEQEHLDLLALARTSNRHKPTLADLDTEFDEPRPPVETLSSSAPPVMFCSTSSDFVTFQPEKSLKFTCLTIGSRGDVQPYIALCKGLMSQGHTCKIASHGEYREWVEGHGISFEEIGGDPAELMQLMIAHDFFTIAFMKEAVGRFRGWLDDLLETTWTACQGSDVLIESPSAIAGLHIAEALRIPYFRAFTMPWSRTRAYPHAFAVPDHKMGGGYNYMTYTMFDQIFWRATAGQVNRWRKKTLSLSSTSLEAMQQHKIPFLYNFSPVIVPPPLDWRENIHVTGYWWLDNSDDSASTKWQPPADLLEFLARAQSEEKKVVFIGFGSIIIPDPAEMTRVVLQAVEKAGVYAIVAKGWSDRASTHDSAEAVEKTMAREEKEASMLQRPYIYNVKSIPHDWLFPRIDAAVHHGGAGTTGASLRAGLPTIIRPFFGDQYFYADRVATLGIGSAVRNFTVSHLASAIVTAVTDKKQIARAKLAGETIRKEDGVSTAIQCIYRDLEYARSLLPPLKTPKLANPSSTVSAPAVLLPSSHRPSSSIDSTLPNIPAMDSFSSVVSSRTGSKNSSDGSSSWDVLDGSLGSVNADS